MNIFKIYNNICQDNANIRTFNKYFNDIETKGKASNS